MPAQSTALPEISVVVPTRDRPAALDACLAALDAQTVSGRLEVVVVDDGSRDPDAVGRVVARHPVARLIRHEPAAGPAAARNTGVKAARGTILCLTDDDCVPEPEWAELLAQAVEQGADAVSGTTLSPGGVLGAAAELIVPDDPNFGPSNNLACAKSLLVSMPFDESYPSAAAEDRDWCGRLTAHGYKLYSERSARLLHRQDLNLRDFLRKQVDYGEGAYWFRRRHEQGRLAPIRVYAVLIRRAFARGLLVGLVVALAQAATALGFTRAWLADRGSTA
jgi:glycosyltransferase involved in cell wall biosynthesis